MLIPMHFNALTVGRSASFVVTSAPTGSTIVLVVQARRICSVAVVPIATLVERVPT